MNFSFSLFVEAIRALALAGNVEEAEKLLPETVSLIDVSARKGIITKENADRRKARLALMIEKAKKAE